jgi:hypothetical protein
VLLESSQNLFSRIELEMDRVSEGMSSGNLDCSDYEVINPSDFRASQIVESEDTTISVMSSTDQEKRNQT